jgi:hypothetical protein
MSRTLRIGLLGVAVAGVTIACGGASGGDGQASASAFERSAAAALRPGEVADLAVTGGVAGGTFTATEANAQYVVVVASTSSDKAGAELAWSIDPTAAPPAASVAPALSCALTSDAWSQVAVPPEAGPNGNAIAVGTTKTVHAWTKDSFEDIQVKAIAVGAHAVVWADVTATHPAELDAAFVSQFLSDFENTILPRERSVFGVESDADGDGHIALVFTPLTHQTAVAFFNGCDLAEWSDCPSSNAGEYLWLTPPNAIDPPYNTPNAIKEILTHELSHLIHFNRKVLRNGLTSWPDSAYMDEGVGGFAQDAIGPQAGNLYVAMAGLDGIADFSLANVLDDSAVYDEDRDGALRGGAYLFVRWLYDRAGGDLAQADGSIAGRGGPALLRALLDAPSSIAKVLPQTVGSSLADLGTDFYTALAMSNRDEVGGVAPANPCFAYLPTQIDPVTGKQRGADVFAKFHGMQMNGVAMTDTHAGTIHPGGAAFVTVAPAASGAPLALTVNVDPALAPRVRVGRLR